MQGIIISAILCGLAGGLGHLIGTYLSNFVSNPRFKTLVRTVSVIITILLGTILSRKTVPYINAEISKLTMTKYEQIVSKHFIKLVEDERFAALIKGKSSEEVQIISRNLAASGMKLLPISDLKNWNSLRLDIANKNKNLCTGFWTGSIDAKEFLNTMSRLPETEIEKWITITLKASFLALENHKSEQHSQEIIAASFNEVANKLDPDSKKVFIENLPKGFTLNSEDACWMMKTLMLTVPSLEESHQSVLLQSLTGY